MAISNEDRAAYGALAVQNGTPDYFANDDHTNAVDALANIMHWCTKHGVNFALCVDGAERHFHAESAGVPR